MTVKKETAVVRYIGLSSDTKPTGTTVPIGSTFHEYDTNDTYITFDSTNWKIKDSKSVFKVTTQKALQASGAYAAEDVLSESNLSASATVWTFAQVAGYNGGSGRILRSQVISETTNITPTLVMYLYNGTPNAQLVDNLPNDAPMYSDISTGVYLGHVDFPALADLGASAGSYAQVTETASTMPFEFKCASGADDIYGILVTRDIFTQGATKELAINLWVEKL